MTPEQEYDRACELVADFDDVTIFDGRGMGFSYYSALIGVTTNGEAVYDYEKMIEYLMREQGWTREESVEWIDYNAIGALGFEGSPIVMYPVIPEEGVCNGGNDGRMG